MESTERAVVRLTEDHTEMTEAGPVEWPPLLDWLDKAVTTVVGRSGGSSGGASIPLNTEALGMLNFIDNRLRLMLTALNHTRANDRIRDTKFAWEMVKAHRTQGWIDDAQWEAYCDEFTDWVNRIEAADDRPRKMELTTPCPRCGERWVSDAESRTSAVCVEFKQGLAPVAECRSSECGAIWAGWEQMAVLGVTIDASMDLAVLEACGIKLGNLLDGSPRV